MAVEMVVANGSFCFLFFGPEGEPNPGPWILGPTEIACATNWAISAFPWNGIQQRGIEIWWRRVSLPHPFQEAVHNWGGRLVGALVREVGNAVWSGGRFVSVDDGVLYLTQGRRGGVGQWEQQLPQVGGNFRRRFTVGGKRPFSSEGGRNYLQHALRIARGVSVRGRRVI